MEVVLSRIDDLRSRVIAKGYEPVTYLDNKVDGKWADKVGGNVALILGCDAMLLDYGRGDCRVNLIEESVARLMKAKWKHGFIFFHTREEWGGVNDKYVL